MHLNLATFQRYVLYIFLFSINFEVWDPFNTGGFFSIAKLTGILYVFSILPDIKIFFRVQNIKQFLTLIWFFVILLTTVNILHINYYTSNFFDFTLVQNIFLFWLLLNHERKEPGILDKGMYSFALGSITLAILYYLGVGTESIGGRVSIFGDNENAIGIRMAVSTIILLSLIIQNARNFNKWRFLLFLPMPVMLLLMTETGSRVAFISFTLSFLVGTILIKIPVIKIKLLIIILSIAGGVLFWNHFMQSGILVERLTKSVEEGNLAGRETIWEAIIPLIRENPILGVGSTGYNGFMMENFSVMHSPHNVILEVLLYTGEVGLFIYLAFLIRLFRTSFRYYKETGFLLPILLFIPIIGLLLSGQLLHVKIGWILFAYGGSRVFHICSNPEKSSRVRFVKTT